MRVYYSAFDVIVKKHTSIYLYSGPVFNTKDGTDPTPVMYFDP